MGIKSFEGCVFHKKAKPVVIESFSLKGIKDAAEKAAVERKLRTILQHVCEYLHEKKPEKGSQQELAISMGQVLDSEEVQVLGEAERILGVKRSHEIFSEVLSKSGL